MYSSSSWYTRNGAVTIHGCSKTPNDAYQSIFYCSSRSLQLFTLGGVIFGQLHHPGHLYLLAEVCVLILKTDLLFGNPA